jgi:hypothetical protein
VVPAAAIADPRTAWDEAGLAGEVDVGEKPAASSELTQILEAVASSPIPNWPVG